MASIARGLTYRLGSLNSPRLQSQCIASNGRNMCSMLLEETKRDFVDA